MAGDGADDMADEGVEGILCWVGSGLFEDCAHDGGVIHGVAVDEGSVGCVGQDSYHKAELAVVDEHQ